MDNLLQQVLSETEFLSNNGQTEHYERFEALVELRQSLVDRIAAEGPLSAGQKMLVQAIMGHDHAIMAHMDRLKNEAAEGLIRLQGYQRQRNGYSQPAYYDGFMFDKRN
ncbi:hypothetical protein GXP70_28145 [Paenibacillus lycopersici]|uniref:Flagellar protein FliT n=1 Tax=Paenibacillus lycopersici TaxID=2704462 RepID=A0A6C0G546_9BACL|nr:hypothetical protein [Paenibacillus lycopersici]QHT63443.1 hypothetical protein GXP70_28145 [Paenibacillus lycopersici]